MLFILLTAAIISILASADDTSNAEELTWVFLYSSLTIVHLSENFDIPLSDLMKNI